MSQIYRPAPRPAVKPPAPRPAMPMSRPAPRPMAKPTTPPPMGGMAGRGPAAAPRPVAKPQAQPGMLGALQSRLQGARPQQKPMGQPEVQVRMPQGSGYTKTAANRIGQPMGQPAGGFVSQQQSMGPESEVQVARPNVAVLKAGPMGGGDDMGDIRSQVQGATSVEQQQQALGQLRSAAGSRPEMQQLMSQAREFGVDENQALMDPEGFRKFVAQRGQDAGMSDDMRRRQEMALRNRDITQAGRPMPMQGNAFAVAPQRLDMAQRLNSMFVPRG